MVDLYVDSQRGVNVRLKALKCHISVVVDFNTVNKQDEQFAYKAEAYRLALSAAKQKEEEEEEEMETFEPCGLKLLMGARCPSAVGRFVKHNTAQRSSRA